MKMGRIWDAFLVVVAVQTFLSQTYKNDIAEAVGAARHSWKDSYRQGPHWWMLWYCRLQAQNQGSVWNPWSCRPPHSLPTGWSHRNRPYCHHRIPWVLSVGRRPSGCGAGLDGCLIQLLHFVARKCLTWFFIASGVGQIYVVPMRLLSLLAGSVAHLGGPSRPPSPETTASWMIYASTRYNHNKRSVKQYLENKYLDG